MTSSSSLRCLSPPSMVASEVPGFHSLAGARSGLQAKCIASSTCAGIGAIVTVMQNRSSLLRLLFLPSCVTQPELHVPSDSFFGCDQLFDHTHQFLDRDFTARFVIVERIIQLFRLLADHKNYCIGPAPTNVFGGVTQVVRRKGVVKNCDIRSHHLRKCAQIPKVVYSPIAVLPTLRQRFTNCISPLFEAK